LDEPVRLVEAQRGQACATLVHAFRDDPAYTYIFPDVDERLAALRSLWDGVVKYSLLYGETYTTQKGSGVACWLLPGRSEMTLWGTIRVGLPLAIMRLRPQARRRCMTVLTHMDELHKRLKRPHYYLLVLGVDPASQGQGIGSRLIQPVLARADREGVPCYLETQTESNVAFYRRRGFEVASADQLLDSGLTVWTMLRQPGT